MEQSISTKIIRNTIFNAVGRFWGILVTLFLTPYIIGHIGVERYGIWALVGAFTGYFGLLDLGIGTSFVKYIAEFYTRKEYKKINQVINTGFIFYLIFAILIIILSFLVINPLLNFFNIPPELYHEATFVFLLGIIIFSVSNALSPFGAIQGGLQRMDISNKVGMAISIPNIAGTIFFLEKGYGLPGLMVNNGLILLISIIVNLVIAFRILPELRFSPFLSNQEMLKKLFKFGCKVQINRLENIITFHTDKIIISHFLNIGLLSFYQLGSIIIDKARELPLILISAIIPATSEIDAQNDKKKLYELYIRGTKYLTMVGLPILTFVFFNASLIMWSWMGEGYEKSVLVIRILAPCYCLNVSAGVAVSIAFGMGKPEFQAIAGAFQLVLNIILSIILVIKIGFVGVVIATLVSLTLGFILFMILFHKYLKYSLVAFLKKTFFVPLFTSILVGGVLNLTYFIYISNGLSNRLIGFGVLGLTGMVFIILYLCVILKTSYLDEYDKSIFKKLFLI